ncbi:eukaryotic translation initiation factor 5A-1-like [Branchiostoma floridae]|uniref:Eukaryotic translation initiation factor 5A n=1 Tax=Branchiostoma floridae TaxID=7739 RepID=A0A9J7L016_BRAFL|nr:eukaryotic translation initiation factor 5A-1-like [Branchiostoma floridae]
MAALEADFESTDEAKSTYSTQAFALRKNGYVMLKDRPCKIVEISTTEGGKHGGEKVTIVGVDIFTGDEYKDVFPGIHKCDVPIVSRIDYEFVDLSDGVMKIMAEDGDFRDIKLPQGDVGHEIQSRHHRDEVFLVTVVSSLGEEMVIGAKSAEK